MQQEELYKFDEFVLDTTSYTLLRNSEPVVQDGKSWLQPKTFNLLLVFVQNAKKLMEKDKLLNLVWPEAEVEDGNLTYQVRQLRKILGDKSKIIQTVHGRGYIFNAEVKAVLKKLPSISPETAESKPLAEQSFNIAGPDSKNLVNPEEDIINVLKQAAIAAMEAEWTVYKSLPEYNLAVLENSFVEGGGAYNRIKNLAIAHRKKGWTIANPDNPSTKCLINIKVEKLSSFEAEVHTEEYWYLRWWDIKKKICGHIYNETNWQKYLFILKDGKWLVSHNIYPSPRNLISKLKNLTYRIINLIKIWLEKIINKIKNYKY